MNFLEGISWIWTFCLFAVTPLHGIFESVLRIWVFCFFGVTPLHEIFECIYFLKFERYTVTREFRECIKDMSFCFFGVTPLHEIFECMFILKFGRYTVTQDFQRCIKDMSFLPRDFKGIPWIWGIFVWIIFNSSSFVKIFKNFQNPLIQSAISSPFPFSFGILI